MNGVATRTMRYKHNSPNLLSTVSNIPERVRKRQTDRQNERK